MTAQPDTITRRSGRAAAAPSGNTRTRILTTARESFLQHGYAGTSMAAIGRALGMSAQALYWHFPSKEALLFTLIEEPLAEFAAVMESDEADAANRLSQMVSAYVLYQLSEQNDLTGYTSLSRAAQSGRLLTSEHQAALTALQRGIYQRFLDTLERGAAAGTFQLADPVATTFAIISMCEYVVDWAHPQGRLTSEAIATQYTRLALRMVAPQTAD